MLLVVECSGENAHSVTNLALGALFLVLALSLFGMYDLTLPNFMARRLQARQQKGGVLGTVFGLATVGGTAAIVAIGLTMG